MSKFVTISEGHQATHDWFEKNNGKKCVTSFTKLFEPGWSNKDIKILSGKIEKKEDGNYVMRDDNGNERKIERRPGSKFYSVSVENIGGLDDTENSNGSHCIPDISFSNVIDKNLRITLTKMIGSVSRDNFGVIGLCSNEVNYHSVEVSDKQFKLTMRPIIRSWFHRTIIYRLTFTFDIVD